MGSIWNTSVGFLRLSNTCNTLLCQFSLVLFLIQIHESTNSIVANLEDSKVMIGIVLIFILLWTINTIKIHYFSSMSIIDIVQSFLNFSMNKLDILFFLTNVSNSLISIVSLFNYLQSALVKHVSHEHEGSDHTNSNNSNDYDKCSGGRTTLFLSHVNVLLFSLDKLFLSFRYSVIYFFGLTTFRENIGRRTLVAWSLLTWFVVFINNNSYLWSEASSSCAYDTI